MVEYSLIVITKIKAAADEKELRDIISASIRDLEAKRKYGYQTKRGFILNLIMGLRYLKAEGLPSQQLNNVNKGIEILENKRKNERENLF